MIERIQHTLIHPVRTSLSRVVEELTLPEIPGAIRQDLNRIVNIFAQPENPPPKLITLFGSLHTGKWDRRKSDIDLGVILETEDPRYSAYTNSVLKHFIDPETHTEIPVYSETPERRELRSHIFHHPELEFGMRYELHMLTIADIERLRAGEIFPYIDPLRVKKMRFDAFVQSLESGRVLYKK